MSETGKVEIQVPGVDFQELARLAIAERITTAMLGAENTIASIVGAAMQRKVDGKGNVSNYRSENNIPYVEWLAGDLISKATQEVLKTKVEALQPVIAKAIEAELRRNSKSIAKTLVEGWAATCKNDWRISINVKHDER